MKTKSVQKQRIKWIVLDMNGVIVRNLDHHILFELCEKFKMNKYKAVLKYLKNLYALQTGKMSSEKFWNYIFKKQKQFNYKKMVDEKYGINQYIDNDFLNKINQLKKEGYKICILSNSADGMSKQYKDSKKFEYADEIVLSEEINAMKPFPKTWKKMLKIIKAKPEECVFVDDHKQNVMIAKAMGFNAIRFRKTQDIEQEIRNVLETSI